LAVVVVFCFMISQDDILAKDKFVTIVNPVRGRELWKDKSLVPVETQYRTINKLNLSATWLIQDDVLFDKELVDKIKSLDEDNILDVYLDTVYIKR